MSIDEVPGAGRLVVTDHGHGMSAETLTRATRRFSRSDESRSRPGVGLGLSLVDAIVAGIGGEIRLCFNGVHQQFGPPNPVPCAHDGAMTVTVLIPTTINAEITG